MDHLIHTSHTHGTGVARPTFSGSVLEGGIAVGHGTEGIAGVIEVNVSPEDWVEAQAQR